ncbi:SRPBCC family protein [Noviherbaspirillum cavernae]|uniref:SRPBCC family protein n=1 Tax=Noviherbaspirillum cavernae TaxID=2320862 RepID=UPI001313E9AF|nr:SRPBCC family protein [Noviherbaspirillum cavernae]
MEIRKSAGAVIIDASMQVKADPQNAWKVLIDYDHMAQFLPNLESSKIIEKTGNSMRVAQKGSISYGPFSMPFESVREIELSPFQQIRSSAAGGSVTSGEATTRLMPEGADTWILYHSELVFSVWVPPGIGPHAIEKQIRAQFESLKREIMKRKINDINRR